jgi:hypothetical protein
MSLPYTYRTAKDLDLLVRGKQLLASLRVVKHSTANVEAQIVVEKAEAFVIDVLADLDEDTNALFITADSVDPGTTLHLVEDDDATLEEVVGQTCLEMDAMARVSRLRWLVAQSFAAVQKFQTVSSMTRHHRLVLALDQAELSCPSVSAA